MKKILVYLEPDKDGLKRTSFETISAGYKLSKALSIPFIGLLVNGNDKQMKSAIQYGLNNVINIKHNLLEKYTSTGYASAIAQVAKNQNACCVLFSGNVAGLELAPRIAVKLEAGYISDCVELNVDNNDIFVKKPVYAGKAMITAKIDTEIKIFSLRPNVFTATTVENGTELNIIDATPLINDNDCKVFVTSTAKNEGKLDVLEADIIVSGGRGIKGPENYNLIETLASVLHGAVGASRAVVDAGWRPQSEQVGQTGKTVSPTLYIACGISGAVQHLAGMSTSKVILAINKDKDAPIFKIADYGIIGDIFSVLPRFTEKMKLMISN